MNAIATDRQVNPSCFRTGQPAFAENDEVALLRRLRAGDEQAYECLVRRYSGRMLAVAQRYLGCSDDSADAVQEAFIAAYNAMPAFAGNSSLATWLHRIVVNVCLMKLRWRSRRRTVPIDDLLPQFDEAGRHARPVAPWPEQACNRLSRAETQAQVRTCIDMLPDDYRSILLIRDIDQLDTEETAELLGISIPAVKTRLHRARQALRTLLDPLMRRDDEPAKR
jgi:RNA polymerase sigma-70 factor (ECF subfamily)